MNNYNLYNDVIVLLKEEPFFASFSRYIEKTCNDNIPTAGVRLTHGDKKQKGVKFFELQYNKEFMSSLSDKHRKGVIMHEFYHIIFGHLTNRAPEKFTAMHNIAMDLAINSNLIGSLPSQSDPGPVIPSISSEPFAGVFPGEGRFKDLPLGQSYEWYLAQMKKMQEEAKANGEPDPFPEDEEYIFDEHGAFGDGEDTEREVAGDLMKEILKKTVKDIKNNNRGWGTVSKEVRAEIEKFISHQVDWRSILSSFIKRSKRSDKHSTPKKLNKRYPRIHAGKKVKRHANIAIAIDQSGSVDDKMLAAFFAELNCLSKMATFTVIPFDDRVFKEKIYVWKKDTTRQVERVLCGGTNFDAPTKYVNEERGFDGMIVLTDLMAPKPIPCSVQRMWMTSKECADNPYFKTTELVIPIVI